MNSGVIIKVENEKLTSLLKKLDQLLYNAKHKSKNLIEYKEYSGLRETYGTTIKLSKERFSRHSLIYLILCLKGVILNLEIYDR